MAKMRWKKHLRGRTKKNGLRDDRENARWFAVLFASLETARRIRVAPTCGNIGNVSDYSALLFIFINQSLITGGEGGIRTLDTVLSHIRP